MLKEDVGVRKPGREDNINERTFCASVVLLTCFPFFPENLLGQKAAGQWAEDFICMWQGQ